jgi:hypothetical protein
MSRPAVLGDRVDKGTGPSKGDVDAGLVDMTEDVHDLGITDTDVKRFDGRRSVAPGDDARRRSSVLR